MVTGWVTGAAPDVQGNDGQKHHVHRPSTLNLSFVAESIVGRVINLINVSAGRK